MFKHTAIVTAILLAPATASAWEYRCRFVERIFNTDFPLAGDTIDASSGLPRRIRIQFGVFDDDSGPAPVGGFVGWNVGEITVSGPPDNSDETRSPGRLSPFNFASGAYANGSPALPAGDPFTHLTSIDATLGTQSPLWLCQPDGTPGSPPPPTLRGFNQFASVYEITVDPRPGAFDYTLAFSGNLIAATEWRTVGSPWPPDCGDPANPDDDIPGSITYAPFPTPPQYFECVLRVVVPAPSAALMGVAGYLLAFRRRRSGCAQPSCRSMESNP